MSYSTKEMLRNALAPGDWSNDRQPDPDRPTNTAADLEDAQLDDAIAEADSFIDGYLAERYTTPVAAVANVIPHPVDFWSRNIAAYNATLTYRKSQDFTDDDPVARRYRATVKALTDVASGTASLDLPPNSGIDSTSAGAPINPYQGNLFGTDDFDLVAIGQSWPTRFPNASMFDGRW